MKQVLKVVFKIPLAIISKNKGKYIYAATSLGVVFLMGIFVNCIFLVCIVVSYVYLLYLMCICCTMWVLLFLL
jgi:hypothetical protein